MGAFAYLKECQKVGLGIFSNTAPLKPIIPYNKWKMTYTMVSTVKKVEQFLLTSFFRITFAVDSVSACVQFVSITSTF